MIRTQIIPETNNVQVNITVPNSYIGKKVEVTVVSEEEMKNENNIDSKKNNISKFRGSLNLSKEQYEDFQQHLKDIRNEWDREF